MKIIIKIAKSLVIVFTLISFSTYLYFNISQNTLGIIATALSIMLGFTVTALSIIGTSKFSKELYRLETENNSQSMLHELINLFQRNMKIYIASIGAVITYSYFFDNEIYLIDLENCKFSLNQILNGIVFTLVLLSFYKFWILIKTFGQFIIQEARR